MATQMSFFGEAFSVDLGALNAEHRRKLAEAKKPRVVAESVTQVGGPCDDCHSHIWKGDRIFKISGSGKTTHYGNGPGKWVCGNCAGRYRSG